MSCPTDIPCPSRCALRARAYALVVLAACLTLIGIGAALDPRADAGFGTHTQIGLPACAWRLSNGLPCPTCGMTTAVSLAAHGRVATAATVQPAGAALALVAAMGAWVAGYVLVTGNAAFWPLIRRHVRWRWTIGVVFVIIGLSWAYRLAMAA